MKTVLVFVTFDTIHPGHISFFQQARRYGDRVVVGIARDQTAKKVKGHPPLNREIDRKNMVSAIRLVDQAFLGSHTDRMYLIRKVKPAVVCLGYDQQAFVDQLRAVFPKLKIVRLKSYRPQIYKSSKLRPV